jgi:hypothetical protein
VIDICGAYEVGSLSELETILRKRHGGDTNSFWLSPQGKEFPRLSLLVKGDLATLLYLPSEGHAGFRPIGTGAGLERAAMTTFSISRSPADDVSVLNDAVIPFSTALTAVKEFWASTDLPPSLQWFEL